jgi:hypothetical protein
MQKSPLGTRRPVIPDPLQHFFVDLLQNHIPLVNCDGKRWNVTWVRWVCALQAGWIPKYQPFTSYIYIHTGWWYTYPSEKYSPAAQAAAAPQEDAEAGKWEYHGTYKQ